MLVKADWWDGGGLRIGILQLNECCGKLDAEEMSEIQKRELGSKREKSNRAKNSYYHYLKNEI